MDDKNKPIAVRDGENNVVVMIARGQLAGIRETAVSGDRDTARLVHAELLRLASEIAERHGFTERRKQPDIG